MNINTSPDQIVRSTGQLTPGYMSGFGNSFETEALPGALPMGAQLAAALRLRAVRRAVCRARHSPRRAATNERFLALPHPPRRCGTPAAFAKADAGLWRTAPCYEYDMPIAQLRWDPAPIPKAGHDPSCRACRP